MAGVKGHIGSRFDAKGSFMMDSAHADHPTTTNLCDIHDRFLASSTPLQNLWLCRATAGSAFRPPPHVSASAHLPVSGNTAKEDYEDYGLHV
jgi:hypothetical protein